MAFGAALRMCVSGAWRIETRANGAGLVFGATRVLNARRIFRRVRVLADMHHYARLPRARWM